MIVLIFFPKTILVIFVRNTKKSEDKIEEMEKDIAETAEHGEKLKEEYDKIQKEAESIMKEHAELQVM